MNIAYKYICVHKDGFTAEFEDISHLSYWVHNYTNDFHNLYSYAKAKIGAMYMEFNVANKVYKFKIDPYEAFNYGRFIHFRVEKSCKKTIIEFFELLENYYNYGDRRIRLFDFIEEFCRLETINKYCY